MRFDRSTVSTPAEMFEAAVATLDVWSDDRPSLQRLWWYAVYGQWTGEKTLGRQAGAAYNTVIALPVTTVLYLLAWVVERPARLAATLLVAGLACLTGLIGVPFI